MTNRVLTDSKQAISDRLKSTLTNQIIGSMKRDFLASGRQPAGVCCAALTLATRVNRIERSKEEIRKVCSNNCALVVVQGLLTRLQQ